MSSLIAIIALVEFDDKNVLLVTESFNDYVRLRERVCVKCYVKHQESVATRKLDSYNWIYIKRQQINPIFCSCFASDKELLRYINEPKQVREV